MAFLFYQEVEVGQHRLRLFLDEVRDFWRPPLGARDKSVGFLFTRLLYCITYDSILFEHAV